MDVRLIAGSDDPYVWDYPQQRESLLQKRLSNHSTGAYVKLISEVGKTIHAVPVRANKTLGAASRASDSDRIQQLQEMCLLLEREYARAVEENIQWQLRTAESLQLESSAEVELAIARAELHSAQDVIQELRCQLAASSSTVQESAALEAYSANGVDLILGPSQKIRPR